MPDGEDLLPISVAFDLLLVSGVGTSCIWVEPGLTGAMVVALDDIDGATGTLFGLPDSGFRV